MPVLRVERTHDYTVMCNHHLKNPRLSLKAKGLLSMMLSFPDGWNYSERGLAAICLEGVDAIHTAIKELEAEGYMTRRRVRDAGGRIQDTEYTIYERPRREVSDLSPDEARNMPSPDTALPYTENPDMVNPDTATPDTANPGQLNTYRSNTQKSNTDLLSTHSINPSTPAAISHSASRSRRRQDDGWDRWISEQEVQDQIDYDVLCEQFRKEQVDEIVKIIQEVLTSNQVSYRIGQDGASHPAELVKGRFRQIGCEHVQMVLDAFNERVNSITNIHAYLRTALFHSVSTIDNYYTARVNHDLYGGCSPSQHYKKEVFFEENK